MVGCVGIEEGDVTRVTESLLPSAVFLVRQGFVGPRPSLPLGSHSPLPVRPPWSTQLDRQTEGGPLSTGTGSLIERGKSVLSPPEVRRPQRTPVDVRDGKDYPDCGGTWTGIDPTDDHPR